MLTWARKHAGSANLLSTHRCVALAPDGHGKFRLWQIVRKKLSLRIHLEAAFASSAPEIATTLLKTAQQLTAAQDAWSKMEPLLAVTLDSVGMDEARCCYIGLMPASAAGTGGASVTATEPALNHQAVLAQKTAIVAEIDTQRRSSQAHEYSDASYSFALRLLGSYA